MSFTEAQGAADRDADAVWRRFEAMMTARDAMSATPGRPSVADIDATASSSDKTWARFEALMKARGEAQDPACEREAEAADIFDFIPAAPTGQQSATPSAPERRTVRLFDLRAALRGAAVASAALLAAVTALDLANRPAPAAPSALVAVAGPLVSANSADRPARPLALDGAAAPSLRAPAIMTPPAAVASRAASINARPSDLPPAPDAPTAPDAVAAVRAPLVAAPALPPHRLSAAALPGVEGVAIAVDVATTPPAAVAGARVVLHHAAEAGAQAAKAVAALQGAGLAAVALRTSPLSVSRTQIRYFHESDREAAKALHGVLRGALPAGAVSVVADFTHYRPSPAPLAVEVWLASSLAG